MKVTVRNQGQWLLQLPPPAFGSRALGRKQPDPYYARGLAAVPGISHLAFVLVYLPVLLVLRLRGGHSVLSYEM